MDPKYFVDQVLLQSFEDQLSLSACFPGCYLLKVVSLVDVYLRSWLSDVSCSIGCISSWGEGVSVAVDW